jgi:predicted transcriptional regulator of viral defense system
MNADDALREILSDGKDHSLAELRQCVSSKASLYRALDRLQAADIVHRVGRGTYRLGRGHDPVRAEDYWTLLSALVPKGVICLLSALAFHGIGTQQPGALWLAVPKSAWRTRATWPPMKLVHYSGDAYSAGIEEHERRSGTVRVYSPAKTVADCFKFRNRVGLDVALEALQDGWRAQRFTLPELSAMARVCRVERVMRPFVQALTA